jgi:hypothetical protein
MLVVLVKIILNVRVHIPSAGLDDDALANRARARMYMSK